MRSQTMRQGNGTVFNKIVNNGGDAVAAVAGSAAVFDIIPAVFMGLGILWFVLRIINFVRVNFFDKKPWRMSG